VEVDFAQIIIRNIEPDVKVLLERRAKRHGRTLAEEIRAILYNAVRADRQPTESVRPAEGLGTRIANRFVGIGLALEIPEWRCQLVLPPKVRRKRRVGKGA
jgi:antitoxin FitA